MLDTKCIYNGHLISQCEPAISFSNRAFRYGDSVFESIRLMKGKIKLLPSHIQRLKLAMTSLRMNIPREFSTINIEYLIYELIKENNITTDARIRLTVFRNDGGFYTPETNDISFLIEVEKIEAVGYTLNQKGFWVDIYAEIKKPISKISSIKTGSALIYIMAGLTKNSLKLDDCLLVNDNGHIIESINSNIFVVKKGALYTSPIADGCIDGVMRKHILSIASENRILTFEKNLTVHTLADADEIFLTNAISGVQWVGQFKSQFYTNKMSVYFNEKLNELTI